MGRPKTKFNINMPLSWEEITLEMFQEISKLYDNDKKPTITDILSVLTNIKKEDIENYPLEVIEVLISQAQYIQSTPTNEVKNEIIIDGEKYFINYENELRFKEFVDAQTLIESNNRDYASLLAILCRKQGEMYTDDYIAKEFDKRVDMFKKQPITKILPIVNFFLNYWVVLEKTSKESLTTIKEAASKYLEHIENSLRSGLGRNVSMRFRMKKLQTLKKSLNCI